MAGGDVPPAHRRPSWPPDQRPAWRGRAPAYVDTLVDLRVPDDEQRRGSSSKRRRKRQRSVTNQMLKYD